MEMSFLLIKMVVVECELSEAHCKVPREVNGDNEKTLLLLTEIFSCRWKLYHKIKRKDFFVASNFQINAALKVRKI